MHEAYQPIIDDGRGRFPEDLRVKAPRSARSTSEGSLSLKSTWSGMTFCIGILGLLSWTQCGYETTRTAFRLYKPMPRCFAKTDW